MELIFGRAWLFLCHESQIPQRGDFVEAVMDRDNVFVVRQKDGSIKAMLNTCAHRDNFAQMRRLLIAGTIAHASNAQSVETPSRLRTLNAMVGIATSNTSVGIIWVKLKPPPGSGIGSTAD